MTLTKKPLGNTGLEVSVLGLGTTKFGRNTNVKYPHDFELPDDKQIDHLLAVAKDNGINIIDTAPAYGSSEKRLGQRLRGQRNDWVIVSKAGEEYINNESTFNFSKEHILASLKRSLQDLQTDYIDVFLIHSDGNDEEIINKYDVFNTLSQAKQQGLIRAGGMSTKTVTGGLLTLQYSDIAMVCYNPSHTEELPVIEAANKLNKGILIKKALGSGHLPADQALKQVVNVSGISSVIVGTINPSHLMANIESVCS